ncbi:MAG: PAC2 family protein [Chloroflexota bacterium]
MSELIELWGKPAPGDCLIAGWQQWADAGEVSSGLLEYLIRHTQAKRVGQLRPAGYYLFQVPGAHHFLRPVVKLKEGHRQHMETERNDLFWSGDNSQGFYLFLGQEPHLNAEVYARAFFDAVEALGVKTVAAVAGVYGAVPHDKDRNISCVYSLLEMKEELARYAVRFSDYEGGSTISMYLADKAEPRGIEFFRFCAFVPSFDFSQLSAMAPILAIEQDHKAWYDILVRLSHMFDLDLDLSDLQRQSEKLIAAWDKKIEQMARTMPHLSVRDYMEKVNDEFTEMSFEPLSDVWTEALGKLLDEI